MELSEAVPEVRGHLQMESTGEGPGSYAGLAGWMWTIAGLKSQARVLGREGEKELERFCKD